MRRLLLAALAGLALATPARGAEPQGPTGTITVAVLGDSRTDGCAGQPKRSECRRRDSGFDQPVLASLLALAAAKRPAAVFFTGDLTLGLEKEEEDGKVDAGALPATGGWAQDFEYQPRTFARMLGAFKHTATQKLGPIPFYPGVGNHDAVGPDAVALFRRTFGLQHPPGGYREPAHLAYTVVLPNAVFVVLATDYYQPCGEHGAPGPACNLQEHLLSQPQLAWLDGQLGKHAGRHLFVLGHEPAFSAGAHRTGLDHNEGARDAFWKVLRARGVTAYLCSHQHQFDAGRHDGVWQVISGGAGAPLDGAAKDGKSVPAEQCTGGLPLQPGYQDRSFFHYLLVNVPKGQGGVASIEVRDCTDKVRRKFDLAR